MPDEPVVTTPPAAEPQVQPGPWEQDIRQSFNDPATAAAVDQFMRARVQPRVTQLEQQVANTRDAQALWDAFHEDPAQTFRSVQQQLVEAGVDVGQATALAQDAANAATAPRPAAPTQDQIAAASQDDPRVAEMYADWQRQRELTAYDQQMEQVINDPANADVNPNLLHTYVAAAEGDFNEAIARYRSHVSQILTLYGVDPTTATPQQQQAAAATLATDPAAPPVMGQGAGGTGAPLPTTPDYRGQNGLHQAIDDATADMLRKSAPPVV